MSKPDELQIAILLVHHLRKQGASDPLNKLSGTTGISGAMDAIFILDRGQRSGGSATLACTGRDIETRKLDLSFSKSDCTWELVQDSLDNRALEMPEELAALVEFMRYSKTFDGANAELAMAISKLAGKEITPKSLKQMMNRWRYTLEEQGVFFHSRRSNGQRLVSITLSSVPPDSDGSAASDATWSGAGFPSQGGQYALPLGQAERMAVRLTHREPGRSPNPLSRNKTGMANK